GASDLGVYTVAFMIASVASLAMAQVGSQPMFAAYSRLRGDTAALRDMVVDTLGLVSAVAIPIGLVLFVGAPAFVNQVLGSKWAGAVQPLQLLAIYCVFM